MKYDHQQIEPKWQQFWVERKTFKATEDPSKQKYMAMDMFPYPSGAGLHVGHPLGYTATDIICRMKRHQGYNVLHPMGWDAFGLPAENYAIKTGVHPAVSTEENINTFRRQIQGLGFSYDWSREFSTTDPDYFKWSQWIFLQLYKKGLAYEKAMAMNWCPKCKIVAANEEVEQGLHERCGSPVEKRDLKQWMFRITDYAERLLNDLEDLPDWPEKIKAMQRNWIGKSEGAEVEFKITTQKEKRGQKGCSTGNKVGPSQFAPIVLSDLVEVNQKKNRFKLSELRANVKVADRQIVFDGAALLDHFNQKNRWERRSRIQWGTTVARSLSKLVYESENVGYFVIKNRVVRVVLNKIDDGVFMVRTFYECRRLSQEFKMQKPRRVKVYTTRPDTLFGATYFVMSPEHPMVEDITTPEHAATVAAYKKEVAAKSDLERTELNKDKTGVFTGAYVENPVNGKPIPVWIADYVLMGYGTGAIMAVPGHDERDMEFAKKFGLEIIEVVSGLADPFQKTGGQLVNSDFLNGLTVEQAIVKIIAWLEKEGKGQGKTNYKLRDWIFTRQRYWGEPIPLIHCEKCGVVPHDPQWAQYPSFDSEKEMHTEGNAKDPISISVFNSILASQAFAVKPKLKWVDSLPSELMVNNKKITVDLNHLRQHFRKKKDREQQFRWKHLRLVLTVITSIQHWHQLPVAQAQVGSFRMRNKIFYVVLKEGKLWTFYVKKQATETWKHLKKNYSLPLELPETPDYEPSADGKSPLAKVRNWVEVACPACGTTAERETSTMPNWAGSSWYWLRYMDPHNDQEFCSKEREQYWGPVDLYVGGAEHAVLHLLYGRFWHKVLYDLGYVSTKEPFMKLVNQGMIAAEDGRKMSKSLGNVINPDDVVREYGADTLRCYEMFMGPFEQGKSWSMSSVGGIRKWLERVHRVFMKGASDECQLPNEVQSTLHKTIKQVGSDIDNFKFNTAISQLMVLTNELTALEAVPKPALETYAILLSPFAPHLAEEMWQRLGHSDTLAYEPWPQFDETLLVEENVVYAVQVNGKVRAELAMPKDADKNTVIAAARELENVAKWLGEGEIRKEVFVPGKIVGFVVS